MTKFLRADKALVATASVVLLLAGWVFIGILGSLEHNRDQIIAYSERIAILETLVTQLQDDVITLQEKQP